MSPSPSFTSYTRAAPGSAAARQAGPGSRKDSSTQKMPSSRPAAHYASGQRLNSWPPTQIRLVRRINTPDDVEDGEIDEDGDGDVPLLDRDPDQAFIDEDPLTYFLTPAPLLEDQDGDGDMAMMDFDAGIEDTSHPRHIIRSVSPSSLDGGSSGLTAGGVRRLTGAFRPPTPPRSPPAHMASDPADSTTDDDEDDEEYIHLGPNIHLPSLPFNLRDFASLKARKDARHAAAAAATDALLLSPTSASFPPGPASSSSLRGRAPSRLGGGSGSSPRRGRAATGGDGASFRRRLSPHSWREPSPDVWSIEELPEEEARNDEAGLVSAATSQHKQHPTNDVLAGLTAPAKNKKRVRFVLPAAEKLHT